LNGFEKAEKMFLSGCNPNPTASSIKLGKIECDKSSTCALIVLIINDICYCANIGDSRALLSQSNSSKVHQITKDHRPQESSERIRLITNGAYIFKYY